VPDTRPKFSQALSKALNRGRRRGYGELFTLAFRRVREWISSSDRLIMFTRAAGGPGEVSEAFTFREAHSGDGDAYALWIATDSAETFRARLSDRTRCFVVTREDKLVHASWVTSAAAWTRELRAYLVPPEGGAYIYESFTRADVRGMGIYPFALRNICSRLGQDGFEHVWVAVEEDNPASVKAVTKAGFEEAFTLPLRRRFGRLTVGSPSGPRAEEALPFVSRTPHRSPL
jgi:ribosomal protein S18 acetylase RimI-like enzyme